MADCHRPHDRTGKISLLPLGTDPPEVSGKYKVFEASTNSMFMSIRLMSSDEAIRKDTLSKITIYRLSTNKNPQKTKVIVAENPKRAGWNYYCSSQLVGAASCNIKGLGR